MTHGRNLLLQRFRDARTRSARDGADLTPKASRMKPDGTRRTWWRQLVEPAAAEEPALEAVLPDKAELERLHAPLFAPGELPGL